MKRLIFILFIVPFLSFSQKIENTKAEALGDRIVITYSLVQGEPGEAYNVSIFCSYNNYRSPLTKVTGDVGKGVQSGTGKRIEWEARSEMGNYRGELNFEIEAIVVAPLTWKTDLASTKRGKTVQLRWRGGDNQQVKIELLKDGVVQGVVGSPSNTGTYDWKVSSKQKPGKDYSLRLVNGRETVTSKTFSIQPKIPMWAKVAVPVVVAGILLIPKSSSSGEARLPAPPDVLN